mgnify:CR=1 FL=1
MNVQNLTSTNVWWDHIPDLDNLNFKEIIEQFLEDEGKQVKFNLHKDINISYNRTHVWCTDFIQDKFCKLDKKNLSPINNFGTHLKKDEFTKLRSHLNSFNLLNCPHYQCAVILKGKGSVVFEFENHREKESFWSVPFEERKIIMWDSDTKYYIEADDETLILNIGFNYKR